MSNNNYAGRVDIGEVWYVKKTGVKENIRNFLIEVVIDSSVFDSTSTARFMINDAKGLMDKLSVEIGDAIQYTFEETGTQKTLDYRITQIKDVMNMDNQKSYVLVGQSGLYYDSRFQTISKAFTGTTSEIAMSLFEQYAKGETVAFWEPSAQIRDVIIPNMSASDAIGWLAQRSKSQNDNVNMRFFQAADQSYFFCSLEGLQKLQVTPCQKYTYNINTQLTEKGAPNTQNEYGKIENLKYGSLGNIDKLSNGVLASTRKMTDLTSKVQTISSYNYWNEFKNSMNASPMLVEDIAVGNGSTEIVTVATNSYPGAVQNYIDNKTAQKQSLSRAGQTIDITVVGSSVVEVGKIVEVEIPSAEPVSSTHDGLDKTWSGRYMVIAKQDIHRKEKHTMTLTLMKDSFKDKGFKG